MNPGADKKEKPQSVPYTLNSGETGIEIDDVHMTANTIFTVWMPYRQMLDARYSSLVHISEGINDIYL